ncbi:MAG TPA: hypothetical protein VII09_04215 [Opitutaceae bacterium]
MLRRLVALSGTTFALGLFIAHDVAREKLRNERDALATAEASERDFETKLQLQRRLPEIEDHLVDIIFAAKPDFQSRIKIARRKLLNIEETATNYKGRLDADRSVRRLIPGASSRDGSDYDSLDRDCDIAIRWVTSLLSEAGSARERAADATFLRGSKWEMGARKLEDMDVDYSAIYSWRTDPKAADEVEKVILSLQDRDHAVDSDLDTTVAITRRLVSARLQELDARFEFWTDVTYSTYALIFVFNVWVVFFTKIKPEAPD